MTSYLSSWWTPIFGASTSTAQDEVDKADEVSSRNDTDTTKQQIDDRAPNSPVAGPSSFKVPELPRRSVSNHVDRQTNSARAASTSAGTEPDIDAPPQFPLPNSVQRSSAPSPSSQASSSKPSVPSFNLAPPSPTRDDDDAEPPSELNIAVTPGTIPIGNMAPPPSTTSKPDFGMSKDGSAPDGRRKRKVALGPGYSPLDWARLTQSGRNLRGVEGPMRVTVEELQKHNTFRDAWTALDGIVYNITPYLRFHPGGQKELLRVAGRDGTKLFMLTHSWVNYQFMLNECAIGPLVKG